MADRSWSDTGAPEILAEMLRLQCEVIVRLFGELLPGGQGPGHDDPAAAAERWEEAGRRIEALWREFQPEAAPGAEAQFADPAGLLALIECWWRLMPLARPETQQRLWGDARELWDTVLGQFDRDARPAGQELTFPFSDRRFADSRWREQPFFALIHQAYLMFSEQVRIALDELPDLEPAERKRLRFFTRAILDALSPANFALTNPLALERAIETGGESLVKGMANLMADLERGQITHTDANAFKLGETLAATPGKVVHETPLYQLVQYQPATPKVLATPLVIFPAWINRYYILDLGPAKSFVRWAVEQGVTVFMVSWRSADASSADIVWDDYVRAQIDAVDTVRARLGVPSAHVVGYCVAGTTLAATLAVLARRREADKVKSGTFFTAQVDFSEAGDLKHFIDDRQVEASGRLAPDGYLDGRYLAATFNLLRGNELIWSYVVRHYLLGEDYPAFDLLHWNGDVTNLPAKWHCDYLRDLYRDNRLVMPDSLSVDGTPIDLQRITTPAYVQAAREDHIAPAESVWKLMDHLKGPRTFVLAGSGHIAGVVNPASSQKYGYWTMDRAAQTYAEFLAGAQEHKGSWWPHWLAWLRAQDAAEVSATGKRDPGRRGDRVIEDAPGRYVMAR